MQPLYAVEEKDIRRNTKLGDVRRSLARGVATPSWEVRATSRYPQVERNRRAHGVAEQTLQTRHRDLHGPIAARPTTQADQRDWRDPTANDTLVNVLWMTMDPGTNSHISGNIDATSNVKFQEMKEAIMKHTTLVGATSGGGVRKATAAMDVSSITSVEDAAHNQSAGESPAGGWAMDETGWPIDEEGNQIDGYIDGHLDFVKGGGKGKEKGECWNCRETGHRAAGCTNTPSTGKRSYGPKGQKGKWTSIEENGKERENVGTVDKQGTGPTSAKNPSKKGKGKGYGKGGWQPRWQPSDGVRSICGLKETQAKTDEEGFTDVKTEKTAKSISRDPAPKASMSDNCPALTAKIGAFERLQEEDDETEEEQAFVFQTKKPVRGKSKNATREC